MEKRAVALVVSAVLATFATTDAFPLRESSEDLIDGRATDKVKYYLYTKANPSTPQALYIDDEESVKKSHFHKSRHTKILIHGWGGSYTTSPNPNIRDAYLSQHDYNIISVDWHEYAKLNYISSRNRVPDVGEDVAELIDFLHDRFRLNFDKLVVIGHSLGAHVAGFAGKSVKRGKLAGIVGLDPAFPLYSYENPSTRLASTDAKYVQTIQTNGNMKGFFKPIGSASFYANWGKSQPGCGSDIDGGCAHGRCVSYYAEAVRGYSFAPIYKCKDFANISEKSGCNDLQVNVQIGDPLHIKRENGIFYFKTNDKPPYGHLKDRHVK